MGFTWSTLNKGTEIIPNQMSEVKDNINSVRSAIGLTPWTWTTIPVTTGNKIVDPAMLELRAALDLTDDENTCSSDCPLHDLTFNDSNLTSENNPNYGPNGCYEFCTSFYRPQYLILNNTEKLTVLDADGSCPGHCNTVQTTYYADHLSWKLTYHLTSQQVEDAS